MLASERMSRRALFYDRLIRVDERLKATFGSQPSTRASAKCRNLLEERAQICENLMHVGYEAWDISTDIEVGKAALA